MMKTGSRAALARGRNGNVIGRLLRISLALCLGVLGTLLVAWMLAWCVDITNKPPHRGPPVRVQGAGVDGRFYRNGGVGWAQFDATWHASRTADNSLDLSVRIDHP